jgi:hypothetical protein
MTYAYALVKAQADDGELITVPVRCGRSATTEIVTAHVAALLRPHYGDVTIVNVRGLDEGDAG